MVKHLFI